MIKNRSHGASTSSLRRIFSAPRCLVAMLTFAATAIAQKPAPLIDINLDPASTAIHWTLNTTVHTVHGTFKLKSGALRIDPASGAASGEIVIDAASGESGDSARDNRMNSVVLESSKYPTITFRPTHVEGKVDLTAPGSLTVDGVMNLHGQDHPMQIAVSLHPKDTAVSSQSHFTIPFVAWGLKDPSIMLFRTDKIVTLDVDAIAVPTSDPATHAANSTLAPVLRLSEVKSAQ
jgi:polyisoprenoid-binding protein YceI